MFKDGMNDFFEFLGFQDAMKKINQTNDNDIFNTNTVEPYIKPDTTKYPYVSVFDDDNDNE